MPVHILLRLLALCLTLGLAPVAFAQDPPPATEDTDAGGLLGAVNDLTDPLVRMKATPVGDGLVRSGEWAVMHVDIKNIGEPVRGELSMTTRTGTGESQLFRRTVELPAGAKKSIRFLYKPGISGQTRQIDFLAGTRSVSAKVPIRWVSQEEVAIGVIGEDAFGLGVLRQTWSGRAPARAPMPDLGSFGNSERGIKVGLIPTAQIPDRANGLDLYNWLVWVDADPTRLSPDQAAAVRAWVAGGGHLLLTTTDRWRQLGQGPLGDLLPVTLSGVRDGEGAARFAGRSRDIAPQAIAQTRPVSGRRVQVLLEDEDEALWTIGTYGLGSVHLLAVDPRLEPIKSGMDRERLWRQLLWLPPPNAQSSWFHNDSRAYDDNLGSLATLDATRLRLDPHLLAAMDLTAPSSGLSQSGYAHETQVFGEDDGNWMAVAIEFLADIPGVAPIPMGWLLAFATVYLLVIGPVDYLVLRALKRQTLTWITFPVSIAIFSALALLGTSYVKGSEAVVTRYEIVDILPGTSVWRGESTYGVYATRAASLSMTPGKGDGVTEFVSGYKKRFETVHGTGGTAMHWTTDTWTLAYVRTAWTAPGEGSFSARTLGDGSIEIRNDTDIDLTDVIIDIGPRRVEFDAFPARTTLKTSGTTSGNQGMVPYPTEALELEEHRQWAVRNATDHSEVRRGHVDWSEWDLIIVGATTGPVEDSVLDGLTPQPRTLSIVRAPIILDRNGS